MTRAELDKIRARHHSFEFVGDAPSRLLCVVCCCDDDDWRAITCCDSHKHSADPATICDVARLLAHIDSLGTQGRRR